MRKLDDRTVSHILAGLRLLQQFRDEEPSKTRALAFDIATDGGTHMPMTKKEIDELCEKINTGRLVLGDS